MNNLPISADDLIGAITKTTTQLADGSGAGSYLKLHKGGFFVYGADDTEVEEESLWAVNPRSFALGFIAWPDGSTGKPLGEEMRSITDDPIIQSTLPAVGGKWVQQVAMQLMCVSGEDVGTEVVYKASSKGGINGFNDFLNQVLINLKSNTGSDKVVPVIELDVNSYKHPDYGKIYTPVFQIKSWSTMDAMPTPDEDEPTAEPVAVAPPIEAPVAADPVVEEPAEPAKKRRRRRKAA